VNERFRELAEQCESFGSWDNKTYTFDKEKFGELIVRECICQCDDENSQKYIMSHFGFTEKDWS